MILAFSCTQICVHVKELIQHQLVLKPNELFFLVVLLLQFLYINDFHTFFKDHNIQNNKNQHFKFGKGLEGKWRAAICWIILEYITFLLKNCIIFLSL